MIGDLKNALGRHAHHFAPSDQDKDTVYLYYKDARPPDNNPDWHLGYYETVDVAEWDGRVCGSVHLWSGDTPWGSNGKFALKPFEGELRRSR